MISQFGPAGFPYSEEAINAALEASRQRLLAVVNNWAILGSEADASEFRTKEAVAVLVGGSNGPAKQVAPRLQAAFQSVGASRLSVVYIPHGVSNAQEEAAFQASMPDQWIKMKHPEKVLGALASVFGGPPRPCLAVFSGDGKVLFNEDASMMVFQLKSCGFPWRSNFLDDFKKNSFNSPGLKFFDGARFVKKAGGGEVTPIGGSDVLMGNDLVGLYFRYVPIPLSNPSLLLSITLSLSLIPYHLPPPTRFPLSHLLHTSLTLSYPPISSLPRFTHSLTPSPHPLPQRPLVRPLPRFHTRLGRHLPTAKNRREEGGDRLPLF